MLITNGKLVTWGSNPQILNGHALLISDDKIIEISPESELIARHPEEDIVNAQGQFILPGNICAHTHFYGAFARGMAIPGPAPKDFPEILQKLWWPLDRSLSYEDVRYSALVCLLDAIKHGTTTLIDHHASPNAIDGSLDIIADSVDQSGLRSVLCYEVTDRDGPERAKAGIHENVRFLNSLKSNGRKNIRGTFGLHASLTLSESTLEECIQAVPDGVGFHVHLAEHEADEYDSLEKSGSRVTDRFLKHGILGPETIVAHAVHADVREISILAETGTWVTHQPRSNMNNGVGTAPVEAMLRAGVNVCLGNDGFSNAMWEEWKTAYLLHKVANRDPRRMNGNTIIQMAINNNAALANRFFNQGPIGELSAGAYADLIFVDYHPTTPLTPGNLPWHMLFGFHESMVTTTIVAGRMLMRNRKLLTLDEEEITGRSQELAIKTWERYQSQF